MTIISCLVQYILAVYLFNTLEFVSINPILLICPSPLFLTFGNHHFIFQYVRLSDYIARLFAQLHSTPCGPMDCSLPDSSVHGKNTKVGCHLVLQGIFSTQWSNPRFLCLPNWQTDSLPLGSPVYIYIHLYYLFDSTYEWYHPIYLERSNRRLCLLELAISTQENLHVTFPQKVHDHLRIYLIASCF